MRFSTPKYLFLLWACICTMLFCGNPLHAAAEKQPAGDEMHDAVSKGDIAQVKLLLNKKPHLLNATNREKWTPLHKAAEAGRADIIALLLDRGADLNARQVNGWTPLFVAVDKNNTGAARLLIARKADVASANKNKETALHRAARRGNRELAGALIAAGADLEAPDVELWTPLMYAALNNQKELVAFLLGKGAKINARQDEGWTALHIAARYGARDALQALLDAHAEVDARNNSRATPLHWATPAEVKPQIAELLIARKANIEAVDEIGYTPLHYAAFYNNEQVVRLLISRGARVESRDKSGNTPLAIAVSKGNAGAVKALLASGASPFAKNNSGVTPLQDARRKGAKELADAWLKRRLVAFKGRLLFPADSSAKPVQDQEVMINEVHTSSGQVLVLFGAKKGMAVGRTDMDGYFKMYAEAGEIIHSGNEVTVAVTAIMKDNASGKDVYIGTISKGPQGEPVRAWYIVRDIDTIEEMDLTRFRPLYLNMRKR